jgi:hypothetical protein
LIEAAAIIKAFGVGHFSGCGRLRAVLLVEPRRTTAAATLGGGCSRSFAQQFQQLHPKGVGNSDHDQQTRVSLAALNPAHVRQVDFSFKRQLLLCQLSLLTIFANILAEYGAPISHCGIGPYGVYCL